MTVVNFAIWTLPFVFIFFMMRRGMSGMGGLGKPGVGGTGGRGGLFGFGQSTARIIKENTGVTFK